MKKKSGSEKWNVNFDGMKKWNKGTEENGKEKDKVRIINRRKYPQSAMSQTKWEMEFR